MPGSPSSCGNRVYFKMDDPPARGVERAPSPQHQSQSASSGYRALPALPVIDLVPPIFENSSDIVMSKLQRLKRWAIKKRILLVYVIAFLVFSVANSIYFKKMTDAVPNYSWYLSMLTTVIFIPIFFMMAWGWPFLCKIVSLVMVRLGIWNSESDDSSGNDDDDRPKDDVPMIKFFFMGFFDAISGVLMILGSVYTAGTTQLLLSQVAIPATMLLTIWYVKMFGSATEFKPYTLLQYVGAATVIGGVVVVQIPSLLGWDHDGASDNVQNLLVFNVIFALAAIPNSASTVFKQFSMQEHYCDPNKLQFYVVVFQFMVNILSVPIYTLSILGPQRVTFSEMPLQITNGSRCLFMGENPITTECGKPGLRACDDCEDAFDVVFTYLFLNLIFNILTILVVMKSSAALAQMIGCLRVPVGTIAFCSPMVMGAQASTLKVTDVLGLIVLTMGLGVYRYGDMKRYKKESKSPVFETIVSPTVEDDEEVETKALFGFNVFGEVGGNVARIHRRDRIGGPPVARTIPQLRSKYYAQLGRDMDPRTSPLLRSKSPSVSSAPGRNMRDLLLDSDVPAGSEVQFSLEESSVPPSTSSSRPGLDPIQRPFGSR